MARHHSLNPEWFGNPGSTFIYPLAALIELWYLVAKHVPPFAHPMAALGREFSVDPTPFYLIGRGLSAAYGVGCVVATWLVGRRIVGDSGAVLAALMLPATAIVVAHGQLVRTDTVGLFFGLVALWLILRAMERGRTRDWFYAAIAIGLALSSRYFLASLVVPYAVGAWIWLRSRPARPVTGNGSNSARYVPIAALALVPVTFAITSPFVFLDFGRVVKNLKVEARTVHPGADGLTPLGNLVWYLGTAAPAAFGPVLLVLAMGGVVVSARRAPRATVVLVAAAASYIVAVSVSPLHWDRYVIPLTPFIGIFATAAVLAVASSIVTLCARWLQRDGPGDDPSADRRHRSAVMVVSVATMLILLLPSFQAVLANDRQQANPSARVLATDWIMANLPPASRIAQEAYTAYLDGTGRIVVTTSSLANRTMDAYRADGIDYLVTSSAMSDRFVDPVRYPSQSAFYRSLHESGRLVASFGPDQDHAGPLVSIYQIPSR